MKSIENFTIQPYLPGEVKEILDLVHICFDEFVAADCNEDGIKFFYQFLQKDEFIKRNINETFTLTAKNVKDQIVGMIEVRNDGHICLLFVSKEFQQKGISKQLFSKAKELISKKASDKVKMTVNSSIYAVDIYKKLGFIIVGNMKTINGISFVEMEIPPN
jgi:ribosomal protein S18 acetylase RimI-like enzyme